VVRQEAGGQLELDLKIMKSLRRLLADENGRLAKPNYTEDLIHQLCMHLIYIALFILRRVIFRCNSSYHFAIVRLGIFYVSKGHPLF